MEKSNDVVFTFDAAGEFLYMSPSVKKMLGYNPTDLIGRTFVSLVHPDDLLGLQQAIQRNIADGSQMPGGNRYRVRHASGEWRWHNAAGNAVRDANGKFLSFVAIARDVTEHKHDKEAPPSEAETTIPVIQEEKPITNKGRILVVDDEPGVRALLDSVLKKVGYSVDTIGDSRAAKDIIDAGAIYDVILMDIRMPGMSGIELYTLATRKMPSLKNKMGCYGP